MKPMNIRSRSSSAVPRSRRRPQYSAMTGNATAATPNPACSSQSNPRPTGPADSNHSPRIASNASTTRPIPRASRAHGRRWLRTDVRAGAPVRRPFVFANYTSRITGRITGLRCVTS